MWWTVLRFLSEWCCLPLSCKKLRTSISNLSFVDTSLWLCYLAPWIRGPDLPPLEQLSLERYSLLKPAVSSDSASRASQKKGYAVQGPRSNPDSTASPISGVCAQWGILFQSRLWEEEAETAWLCVSRSAVSAESYFRNPGLPPPAYLSHASLTPQPSLSYSPFLEQHHWSHSLPDLISLGHFRQ